MKVSLSEKQSKIIIEALDTYKRINNVDSLTIDGIKLIFVSERMKHEERIKENIMEELRQCYFSLPVPKKVIN